MSSETTLPSPIEVCDRDRLEEWDTYKREEMSQLNGKEVESVAYIIIILIVVIPNKYFPFQ
jgi:hypothetical protein